MLVYLTAGPRERAVALLNSAFDERLKGHRAKPRSEAEAHFHTARADALTRAARQIETAEQESAR